MRSTEQAAGASSLIPRRIADKVVRINAQELRELSQQISAGTLSVEQFLNRIGLSSGIEVTLALPHERVVTLRRAGSRDVIWVDPAISVDLVNALVSGKIDHTRMGDILTSSVELDPDKQVEGFVRQGFAIQGVLPERADFTDQADWRKQAILGAAVAVHELAHLRGDTGEYGPFKREFEYRYRLSIEPKTSPRQLLDMIAQPPYTPRQILQAVIDAARDENAPMVTAEPHYLTKALWYGSTAGGRCALLLRAFKGKDGGGWTFAVSRFPLDEMNNPVLFRKNLLLPLAVASVSAAELRARATPDPNTPQENVDGPPDPERAVRRGVALTADSFMARVLKQAAEKSQISRTDVRGVLYELGLVKNRFSFSNLILDLFRA